MMMMYQIAVVVEALANRRQFIRGWWCGGGTSADLIHLVCLLRWT